MSRKLTDGERWDRFWSRVDKAGDCWLWTGSTNPDGYGVTTYNGKSIGAYRLSWILTHGEITVNYRNGGIVLHKCDNRLCVKPDHLQLGTHQENSLDIVRRGRHKKVKYDTLNDTYKPEFGSFSATAFFNYGDEKDIELLDYLQSLPHGKFSERTKMTWRAKMEIEKVGFVERKENDK